MNYGIMANSFFFQSSIHAKMDIDNTKKIEECKWRLVPPKKKPEKRTELGHKTCYGIWNGQMPIIFG
jgi:hypothetical protein